MTCRGSACQANGVSRVSTDGNHQEALLVGKGMTKPKWGNVPSTYTRARVKVVQQLVYRHQSLRVISNLSTKMTIGHSRPFSLAWIMVRAIQPGRTKS